MMYKSEKIINKIGIDTAREDPNPVFGKKINSSVGKPALTNTHEYFMSPHP